jgi:hypothetical protein
MSHRGVEIALGRLATDEGLRRRFQDSRADALRELTEFGLELSPVELSALQNVEVEAVRRFAEALDPRLQKALIESTPEVTANGG